MDRFGYGKTVDVSVYERNKEAADQESRYIVHCMNTDKICIFTDAGQMHLLKVVDLPHGKFRDKGVPVDNLSNYSSSEENLIFVTALGAIQDKQLVFAAKSGMIKLVSGSEFDVSKRTTAATKLTEEDTLIYVAVIEPEDSFVMQSEKNMFLRIAMEEIPQKKKAAIGVRGMRLADKDQFAACYVLHPEEDPVVTVREKEVHLGRLHLAKRDTKGVKK